MHDKPAISGVNRSRAEAQASYDRMSGWYDLLAGSSEKRYAEAGLELLSVRAGEQVLEIGSGTGHALVSLARAAGAGVVGLDLSPGMLHIAGRTLQKANLLQDVGLVCADGLHLPFNRRCFDAIFMSFTLELFDTPEIPQVLAECRRVLRPGGRISVVAMAKRKESGLMVRLYEWAHANYTNYVDCRPIYVRESIESAGFTLSHAAAMVMFGLPVDVVLAENPAVA